MVDVRGYLSGRSHGRMGRLRRGGAVTPILRAEAEFIAPARYDDVLAIAARVEQWEARHFHMTYTLSHGDRMKPVPGQRLRRTGV
jgi:acyl-CoA thioesterase FadM